MKLRTKLILFSALTSLAIVILFVLLVPSLMSDIAFRNTNNALASQKDKVLKEINQNGIAYYLEGEEQYGSYTMLKDEYISIVPSDSVFAGDKYETSERAFIDGDTINYRILRHTFSSEGDNYMLEVAKKISSINQDSRDLQKAATLILGLLIMITLLTNFLYTGFVLKPFNTIIEQKLKNRKFPFKENIFPVKTSTHDFKYLDNSVGELMSHINYAFDKEREFTSNASHELMTPISIMHSKIENMMIDESLTDAQYLKLEELMMTLRRLRKIVHSLLLISRIENEQYIREDIIKTFEIIDEVVDELSHRISTEKITLNTDVNKEIVISKMNRDLIFQLFYNLINNAIKYNQRNGSIFITDEVKENAHYTVFIRDTGLGIPEEKMKDVFNRFSKAHKNKEGYGLGLSIVQSIAQYHNIDIKIQSKENEGTLISVIFPYSTS